VVAHNVIHSCLFASSCLAAQLIFEMYNSGLYVILFMCLLYSAVAQPMDRGALNVNSKALNFIVMGDWGRNGEDHQKHVADQMGKTAALASVDFIISTGDNFYPKGVASEYDPLWKYSFEDVYTAFSLQWDWYPVLGNHDYGANPDAQVAYSRISRRWRMPSRYYTKTFSLDGDSANHVLLVFIDTCPLIRSYYFGDGHAVHSQDSTLQRRWLENVLADPDGRYKWKFVIGHHPMYTGGGRTDSRDTRDIRRVLESVLQKHKVNAYLAGHEHSLQYILPNPSGLHHFISGAASEVTPVRYLAQTRFATSDYGFLLFSVTNEKTLVQFVNHEGRLLYKCELTPQ
jgi:tartrate-resistant acid phosphatase type 5